MESLTETLQTGGNMRQAGDSYADRMLLLRKIN